MNQNSLSQIDPALNVSIDRQKSPHQQRVELFMRQAGQAVPGTPTVPTDTVIFTRLRLLFEELLETAYDMGVDVFVRTGRSNENGEERLAGLNLTDLRFIKSKSRDTNLAGVADGLADISVVNTGTMSAFGLADESLLEEVDNNNLAKFGPGGYMGTDGKYHKPPDHRPPDINKILALQGLGVLYDETTEHGSVDLGVEG